MAFVRYFSDVKDDKHTMKTCIHESNVRFFHLFVKLECPDLPYLSMLSRVIPDDSFFFFTNAAKQTTKEKFIIGDKKIKQ